MTNTGLMRVRSFSCVSRRSARALPGAAAPALHPTAIETSSAPTRMRNDIVFRSLFQEGGSAVSPRFLG